MEKREGEGEQLPWTVPYVANAFNVYHSNQYDIAVLSSILSIIRRHQHCVQRAGGGVENVSVQRAGGVCKHLETESAKFAQKLPNMAVLGDFFKKRSV